MGNCCHLFVRICKQTSKVRTFLVSSCRASCTSEVHNTERERETETHTHMAGGGHDSTTLLSTPTWAIACTCAILIAISLLIERALHLIGHLAEKYDRAALLHAFQKIKDELLMVGILSLALAMGQDLFTKVCVPAKWYNTARLCKHPDSKNTTTATTPAHEAILHLEQRQLLSEGTTSGPCKEAAFFKQFYTLVSETDYITMRAGFIKSHFAENPGFNFHKYIERSFQDDFKHVVGISWRLWLFAILWLLVNIHGTKMQHVLTQMANEIQEQHAVIVGMPLVKPNDRLFWLGRPRFILQCLHFIVFQNAMQTAYAVWAAVTFPSHNCLYEKPTFLVVSIVIGVVVQVVCGLFTLPTYALVSQMGSHLKTTIFNEHVNLAMSRWRARAVKKPCNMQDEGSSHHLQQVEMVVASHDDPRSSSST